MDRVVLQAKKGMILTDGKIYGETIYLENGRTADEFYEITKEEHEKLTESEEAT